MELFNEIQSGCEADACQPLIAYLDAQKRGKFTPPYVPTWDLMPLHKLCRLARLWSEAGFTEEAGKLVYWLLQFRSFPTLWCPENEYKGSDFFSELSAITPIEETGPDFGLTLFHSPTLSAAFTLAGNGTSLGAIRTPKVEIRSLGPQALPFSDPNRFGIRGRGMDGWANCYALPEVWLQLKAEPKESECKIDVQFVGLTPETPLAFVFYVKAESCQVGHEILKPKSLRRFHGKENKIQFGPLVIDSLQKYKVEVIPLAGEGCFWDTEFLVAFEMPPFDCQATFLIGN
jgi:hypothetical protein